ncbi:MAG: peptidoglycan-binding domain-containing protein [Deltaproteobacteria bacterium]
MKLHDIAVAAAVLSFAGAAVAAGNDATSSSTPARGQSYSSGQSQSAQSPSSSTSSNTSAQQSDQSGASSTQAQNSQTVRDVQQALKQKGFEVGAVDGQMGPETQSALREFQQSQGLPQSGNLDQQTLTALGVNAASSQSTSSQGQGAPASGTSSMSSGASASSGNHDTDQGMQQNRDRMQNNGTTNGTETTPATPK